MCRNITLLYNFAPPATEAEIQAAALQYVRKVSGMNAPSEQNREAFDAAVARVTDATRELVFGLQTKAPPKSREDVRAAARARGEKREAQLRKRYGVENGKSGR